MYITPLHTAPIPTVKLAPIPVLAAEVPAPPVDLTDAARSTRIGGGIMLPQPVPADPTAE
jgi:hypothetical protein